MNMLKSLRMVAIWGSCLLALTGSASSGVAGTIEDRAAFFSTEAVKQAEVRIAEIQKQHNAELRIESMASLSESERKDVAGMDKPQRQAFFTKKLQQRAGEIHARGVLILIWKDPAHLEVGAGREFRNRGFTAEQRNNLSRHLLEGMRKKDFDGALKTVVADFAATATTLRPMGAAASPLSSQHSPASPMTQRSPSPNIFRSNATGSNPNSTTSWIWGIAILLIIVWIFTALFRGVMGAGGVPGPGGMPYGGGSFGGGFLSGLFGSMAGMWLYDSMFRGSAFGNTFGHTGHSQDMTGGGGWNDSPVGTTDGSDFETSGGDFGSDTGGDFGGGDFGGGGGGDFGGGDFGGGGFGGGDFGGGGGDFG